MIVAPCALLFLLSTLLAPGHLAHAGPARLVAGGEHTCLLNTDGSARCWGSNEFGTLLAREDASMCGTGRRPAPCVRKPVALGDGGWRDLAIGSETLCGLRDEGAVHCWGRDWLGTLGRGTATLEQCAYDLGEARDCSLILDTGQITCADLGTHETKKAPCALSPAPVEGLPPATRLFELGPAFCALTPEPYCWGADEGGVLSDSVQCSEYYACSRSPQRLKPPGNVRDIGHRFMTVVLDDGTVRKLRGGGGDEIVVGLSEASSITDARYWGCAVTGAEQSVMCWGQGSSGQLGAGELEADEYGVARSRTPLRALGTEGVSKLVSDSLSDHVCALRTDGTLWCWGNNGQGQLGLGDTDDRWRPTQVPGLGPVIDVAAGSLHTCALVESGEVYCWGADHLGQVGASDHSCALDYIFDPGPAPCQLSPVRSLPR